MKYLALFAICLCAVSCGLFSDESGPDGLAGTYVNTVAGVSTSTNVFKGDSAFGASKSGGALCDQVQTRSRFKLPKDSICFYERDVKTRVTCDVPFPDWKRVGDICTRIRVHGGKSYEILQQKADPLDADTWILFSRVD